MSAKAIEYPGSNLHKITSARSREEGITLGLGREYMYVYTRVRVCVGPADLHMRFCLSLVLDPLYLNCCGIADVAGMCSLGSVTHLRRSNAETSGALGFRVPLLDRTPRMPGSTTEAVWR